MLSLSSLLIIAVVCLATRTVSLHTYAGSTASTTTTTTYTNHCYLCHGLSSTTKPLKNSALTAKRRILLMQYPSGRRIPSLALQLSSTNDHQELVSANLSTSTSSTGSITYRNAREDDLAHIATLLTDTFEGPYAWYRQINRRIDIEQMRSQLADRFFRFILAKKKHSMIVAMHNNDVIGFLELGTLPCPVPRNVTWQNTTVASTAEVPFLGNIAIATDFRRKQVASKLLMIGNKIVQKWNDTEVFVAVECDNTAALRLYQKTGFEVELDERDLIQPPKRNPRIFLRLPIVS